MPLRVSTKSLTHDLTITIDDEPIRVHVKRLTKDELVAFRRDFMRFGQKRGTAEEPEDQAAERRVNAQAFVEQSITNYVAFEPGDVEGDDGPVVTGAQIIEAFYGRSDVIGACYEAIFSENCLGKSQKKILNSLSIFSPGSTPLQPSPDGLKPGSIAAPVESSSTAIAAAATGDPEPAPSGDKVH
jgi:hypothetical protein